MKFISLEMKNYNSILKENQKKHQHYHQAQLLNMDILQVKKYSISIKVKSYNKLTLHKRKFKPVLKLFYYEKCIKTS